MKNRHWIILTLLLLLLTLVFFWWRSRQPKSSEPQTTPPSSSPTLKPKEQAAPAPATTVVTPAKREQMGNLLGGLNHKNIEFYGKVVDQAGMPLPDVAVYASVLYNTGLTSGMAKCETKSDTRGFFSISGMKGRTLGLSLVKPGYEYDGEKGPFHFTELVSEKDRYMPDLKNPVILTMWKLQGAEPMVQFSDLDWRLSVDGPALRIDLATGKRVSTGGDVVIEVNHPLAEPGKWLQRYPWSATVAAPEGGLTESTSRQMYQAPESGYTKAFTYQETGKEEAYMGQFDKQFYVKTRNGTYARLKLHLSTQTNPGYPSYIVATWWLNPKPGSRNLEFDPAKLAPAPTSKP
ncbi:MAG: carboxypeptidase-like regulatory domain-containing protein [Opitutaceae bacterium]|jgi:hypothetical protein